MSLSKHVFTASCLLATAGDFVVTFILGANYPGYSSIDEPESHLGIASSPVAGMMNTWGLIFCFFLVTFAYGLKTRVRHGGYAVNVIVMCVILYGMGEGAVSALFPFDHINGTLTFSGWIHTIFGAIAGAAIVLIPFLGTRIFPKIEWPGMNAYSWTSFWVGLVLIFVFLISHKGYVPFMGLWQRLFIMIYHLYLSVLAIVLFGSSLSRQVEPEM